MVSKLDFSQIVVLLLFSNRTITMSANNAREEAISTCFHHGYCYSLIMCFMEKIHGISISLRLLKKMNLKRHPQPLTRQRRDYLKSLIEVGNNNLMALVAIFCLLKKELTGSSSLLGYRALWHRLRLK